MYFQLFGALHRNIALVRTMDRGYLSFFSFFLRFFLIVFFSFLSFLFFHFLIFIFLFFNSFSFLFSFYGPLRIYYNYAALYLLTAGPS
jgi:hypothetical protein